MLSKEGAAFLLCALVLNTLTAPMVKLTQNASGGYSFNQNCVYFFAECLKLSVTVVWCSYHVIKRKDESYSLRSIERSDVLQYAVPGFVFFAQNNLSFLALQHMSSAAFQLLLNTRIIAVAVMTVVVLGKRLNAPEWSAVILLMVGAMQYELSSCTKSLKISSKGMGVMFIIVMCAASGNIYTQKVMQKKMNQPLMLQNMILYAWGILFNGINWMNSLSHKPALGDMGFWQYSSVVFYALYGLSISVILKQFGSITRTFINTAAVCLTTLLDIVFLGETVTLLEGTTFAVIFVAIYIFSVLAPEFNQLQVSRSGSPDEKAALVQVKDKDEESGGEQAEAPSAKA